MVKEQEAAARLYALLNEKAAAMLQALQGADKEALEWLSNKAKPIGERSTVRRHGKTLFERMFGYTPETCPADTSINLVLFQQGEYNKWLEAMKTDPDAPAPNNATDHTFKLWRELRGIIVERKGCMLTFKAYNKSK